MAGSFVHPLHARHAAPRSKEHGAEAPAWHTIVLMFLTVTFLAVVLIAICFGAAELATGHGFI